MGSFYFVSGLPMRIYEESRQTGTKEPLLTAFLTDDPLSHDSVLIFPGGGYDHVSLQKEGTLIAEALNAEHLNAFVLDYRVVPAHRDEIICDAVRAVQFIRCHSWCQGSGGQKLAVMGFSAGGHLAITEAEHWQEIRTGSDSISLEPARPDALILCYPVITFTEPFAHRNSRQNFLGSGDADREELREQYSAEKQVFADLPPVFIWHCRGDSSVPVENSILLSSALTAAGVDHKLTMYSGGAHGLGLAKEYEEISGWFSDCISWMKKKGFR